MKRTTLTIRVAYDEHSSFSVNVDLPHEFKLPDVPQIVRDAVESASGGNWRYASVLTRGWNLKVMPLNPEVSA